jgi:F0F1-type ATP synthase assembly protein I
VVIGGGLGYVIDRGAGTSPLFTLIGLGFGLVTAVVMAVARIREYL